VCSVRVPIFLIARRILLNSENNCFYLIELTKIELNEITIKQNVNDGSIELRNLTIYLTINDKGVILSQYMYINNYTNISIFNLVIFSSNKSSNIYIISLCHDKKPLICMRNEYPLQNSLNIHKNVTIKN